MTAWQFTAVRWLMVVAAIWSVGVVSVAGFCWIVDPYAVYRDSGWRLPHHLIRNVRMFKPRAIERAQPSILITGQSRVEQGLDPRLPMWGARAYNAALSGATLYEMRRMIEHAVAVAPIRRIVMELAPENFLPATHGMSNPSFSDARLAVGLAGEVQPWCHWSDALATLGSLEVFFDSAKALIAARDSTVRRLDQVYTDGMLADERIVMTTAGHSNRESFDRDLAMRLPSIKKWNFRDKDGRLTGIDEIERIATLTQDHQIQLQLYFSPEHVRFDYLYRLAGQEVTLQTIKQTVVTAVRRLHPAAEVWDFSTASNWTTELIPPASQTERTMRFYNDGIHYTPTLGCLIIKRLCNQGPDGFGVRLDNLTDLTVEWRRQAQTLDVWATDSSDECRWLSELWSGRSVMSFP